MKKLFFILLFFTSILVRSQSSDLKFVTSSEGKFDYYVKISSIKSTQSLYNTFGTIYKVWVYVYPQPGYLKSYQSEQYKESKITGYLKLEMSKHLYAIDCDERKMAVQQIVDYDKSGNVISNASDEYATFDDIIPDSIGESIAVFICNTVK